MPQTGGKVGIIVTPNADDATWRFVPGLSDSSNFSIASASKDAAYAGKYITYGRTNTAPCNYAAPDGDVLLTDGSDAAAATFIVGAPPPPPPLPRVTVNISASSSSHRVNPLFIGCHSDPGYTQEPRGWYAQLVYGESFEQGTTAKSGYAWQNVITSAGVTATVALDPAVTFNPNRPVPSLSIAFTAGAGVAGWANRGIGNEGMALQAGRLYEGYVFVLAPAGASLWVAAADYQAGATLGSATLAVAASPAWQQVNFSFTLAAGTACTGIAPGSVPTIDCGNLGPNVGHICVQCGGELQVGLAAPGAAHIGYVLFQPGAWGRVPGLSVLKSAADTMATMGTRVIRQGGTVSQSFRWKEWRGVPWARGSLEHVWGDSLVSGWGPFEFIDMCAALNIKPILTLAYDTNSVQDWADLVDYTWGDASTAWGAVRIYNDSHPQPYNITTWELGNEQENPDFVAQVTAMEGRRKAVGAPPLQYMYPTNQGVSKATAAALVAAGVPPAAITPDCHVGGGGGIGCATAAFNANPDFAQSAINCETNAAISTMDRALQESADLQDWFNFGAQPGEDPARLIARTASFCAERSGVSEGAPVLQPARAPRCFLFRAAERRRRRLAAASSHTPIRARSLAALPILAAL